MALPKGWNMDGWQDESGQAWVYRVRRDNGDQNAYALKRLKNPSRRGRFKREVQAMDRLRRDGAAVPAVVASDLDDQRPWFVMPWFDDGSLEARVASDGYAEDLSAAVSVLIELAEVLDRVHVAGYAHRDLKPANVLMESESVVLTDFGLCLELDEGTRVTESREAIGSRFYIAPENEAGINPEVDQRPADFYAFGKLAWAVLAGRETLPREMVIEPENRVSRVRDRSALAPIDNLIADLVIPDPRARLKDWSVVLRELRSTLRALDGANEMGIPMPREDLLALARRFRNSSPVRQSVATRDRERREASWTERLLRSMSDRARLLESRLAPLQAELNELLSVYTTQAGPPTGPQIRESCLTMPEQAEVLPGAGPAGGTGFLIHPTSGSGELPSLVVRVFALRAGNDLWLGRLPMITPHGEIETVAHALAPVLARSIGPLPMYRQSSIDEAKELVDDTAARFLPLLEGYLRAAEAGLNLAADATWEGVGLDPIDLQPMSLEAVGDIQAPDLRTLEIVPTVIDITGPDPTLSVRVRLIDDVSGVAGGSGFNSSPSQARLRSPSGQLRDAMFDPSTRISGDALDGVYEDSVRFDPAAERGRWVVEYVMAVDQVGNRRSYSALELADQGFPTSFELR